ncbi:MAG: hypothetical protein VB876_15385, partial [Pirellulales bacterium]
HYISRNKRQASGFQDGRTGQLGFGIESTNAITSLGRSHIPTILQHPPFYGKPAPLQNDALGLILTRIPSARGATG